MTTKVCAKGFKWSKISKGNEKYKTNGLKLFNRGRLKTIVSYSKSLGGRKWCDNNKVARNLGYFKSEEHIFMARALIIGKHKFSLLIAK